MLDSQTRLGNRKSCLPLFEAYTHTVAGASPLFFSLLKYVCSTDRPFFPYSPLCSGTLPTSIISGFAIHLLLLHTTTYIKTLIDPPFPEEHEMDGMADEAITAGTTAVHSPTRPRSNENQRPRNPGLFSSDIPSNRYHGYRKPTLPDAPSQLSPSEHEAVPTDTGSIEAFDELLASLESDDERELSTEPQTTALGEARPVPSVFLETPPSRGLDDAEVSSRRKRYGWNVMKEGRRSHLKTFLMFFVGPIQFVMLVCKDWNLSRLIRFEINHFLTNTTF